MNYTKDINLELVEKYNSMGEHRQNRMTGVKGFSYSRHGRLPTNVSSRHSISNDHIPAGKRYCWIPTFSQGIGFSGDNIEQCMELGGRLVRKDRHRNMYPNLDKANREIIDHIRGVDKNSPFYNENDKLRDFITRGGLTLIEFDVDNYEELQRKINEPTMKTFESNDPQNFNNSMQPYGMRKIVGSYHGKHTYYPGYVPPEFNDNDYKKFDVPQYSSYKNSFNNGEQNQTTYRNVSPYLKNYSR